MFRTANSTNYPQSLGEKLKSFGWKKLSKAEKQQILQNFTEVAPFILPLQVRAISTILNIEVPKVKFRNTEKETLAQKIKDSLDVKRREEARKFNT